MHEASHLSSHIREISIPQDTKGALVIPEVLDGKPVTSISKSAFLCCQSLTSVTIPSGVTNVGERVFKGCSSLKAIEVVEGNSRYSSLDAVLFDCERKSLVSCPEAKCGEYAIPSGVANINSWAFESCKSLTSVTIPASVMNIGVGAFDNCSSLNEIVVEEGNNRYSSKEGVLFDSTKERLISCPAGKCGEYAIPSGVTSVGQAAFDRCQSLVLIKIPSSVTSIGGSAFWGCSSLTSVMIPSTVTNIGDIAFYGCSSLKEIVVAEGNSSYSSIDGVLFDAKRKNLICCPVGKIGDYTIPSGVASIGPSAFWDCCMLTSVTIPSTVTNICEGAFRNCRSLASVKISSAVKCFDRLVFEDCQKLKSVNVVKDGKVESMALDDFLKLSVK